MSVTAGATALEQEGRTRSGDYGEINGWCGPESGEKPGRRRGEAFSRSVQPHRQFRLQIMVRVAVVVRTGDPHAHQGQRTSLEKKVENLLSRLRRLPARGVYTCGIY
jgi:hypothetical protein